MARFRLLSQHYIQATLLPAGTEVGEGTPYPITVPSMEMEGVDEEGIKAVEARQKTGLRLESSLPIKMKDSK